MEVINDLLNYDNLKIYQNTDWFKFSLDSVLLANFVTINNTKNKVIDFCTGNAPIPLILSKKVDKIIGVELQKEVYDLAVKSVKINNLEEKIKIINENVLNLKEKYGSDTFDCITCNPPYFKKCTNSKLNNNKIKSIARHEIEICLDDILKVSKCLLKNNGNLAIVHRTERFFEILQKMKANNLEPKKIRFVYPKKNMESNIVLIEATKNGNPGIKILPPLFVHNENGDYLEEILDMFG